MEPVAFFDLDKTLVRANTGILYARWRYARGETPLREMVRVLGWSLQYTFGVIDASAVSTYAARTIGGRRESDFVAECDAWYDEMVRPLIAEAARVEVERRRQAGQRTVILTGSTPYAARPLMRELGMDDVIASTLVVRDGVLTGEVEEPLCFGEGKVIRAERWAAAHGARLEDAVFYTDSISDLPMLLRVREPRVVNPDPRLAIEARRRGWRTERW